MSNYFFLTDSRLIFTKQMWRHFRRITTDNISESEGDSTHSSSNSHAHGEADSELCSKSL